MVDVLSTLLPADAYTIKTSLCEAQSIYTQEKNPSQVVKAWQALSDSLYCCFSDPVAR